MRGWPVENGVSQTLEKKAVETVEEELERKGRQ